MQAIKVKYIAPTNTRGTRYKASTSTHCATIDFNYALDHTANELEALEALTVKLGWYNKTWVRGVYKEDAYFVQVTD